MADNSPLKMGGCAQDFMTKHGQDRIVYGLHSPSSNLDKIFILLSLCKSGYGSKAWKRYAPKINLKVLDDPIEEHACWRTMYTGWADFDVNIPLLVGVNIINSIEMRLTSFYDDETFLDFVRKERRVPPFHKGLNCLSYKKLLYEWREDQKTINLS